MFPDLPLEVLEHIFTDKCISQKDLLQLQLTCKKWSPIARRNLYKRIQLLHSYNLYEYKGKYHPRAKKRLALLVQSLLLLNSQARRYVKHINFDDFFRNRLSQAPFYDEDSLVNIAVLAHFCPNIIKLEGCNFPAKFYEILLRSHRNGHLQHLEHFTSPKFNNSREFMAYHAALLEFKDTLKQITIKDAVSTTLTTECLISPISLQLFSCAERVSFEETTRVHLHRFKDYIANCNSNVKHIVFRLEGPSMPLQAEYNVQSVVDPQENVQELYIFTETSFASDELAFIMHTFPSVKKLTLETDTDVHRQHDIDAVIQFFDYASLIPDVSCNYLWFEVSQGLGLLPHLANSLEIKEVYIDCREAAAFTSALENLKSKFITSATIGPALDDDESLVQEVHQQSIDYIIENYSGLQDLMFNGVVFPSAVPRSNIQRVTHLRNLHLDSCKITEDYFARLSCQFERIDCFKYTCLGWDEDARNRAIKIYLPFTELNTLAIETSDAWPRFLLKVWANCNCISFEMIRSEDGYLLDLEECDGASDKPDHEKIIVHCASLKKIDYCGIVIDLP